MRFLYKKKTVFFCKQLNKSKTYIFLKLINMILLPKQNFQWFISFLLKYNYHIKDSFSRIVNTKIIWLIRVCFFEEEMKAQANKTEIFRCDVFFLQRRLIGFITIQEKLLCIICYSCYGYSLYKSNRMFVFCMYKCL